MSASRAKPGAGRGGPRLAGPGQEDGGRSRRDAAVSRAPWPVVSRVLAAVVGGLGLASAATVALALVVPPARSLGVALAVPLFVPLWLAAMVPGFLARRATRSWLLYATGTGLCAALAWVAQ